MFFKLLGKCYARDPSANTTPFPLRIFLTIRVLFAILRDFVGLLCRKRKDAGQHGDEVRSKVRLIWFLLLSRGILVFVSMLLGGGTESNSGEIYCF